MPHIMTSGLSSPKRRLYGALRIASMMAAGLLLCAAALADPPPQHKLAPRVQPIPGSTPAVPQPNINPFAPTNPWTDLGPAPLFLGIAWSGRIAGIAADPTNANTIFVAPAGGGVWKSTDGGSTYTPLTDAQPTLAMGAIAIAPSNHNVIYAGTGEANNSEDCGYGYGVLKSTDGGSTWALQNPGGVFTLATISKIAVDPGNANIAYVAVTPPGLAAGAFAYGGPTGIWKTSDGGSTWTNTTASISTGDSYSDVVIDSHSGNLYAAVGTTYGTAANGVYESTNGGTSWAVAGNFPGGSGNGRISLALFPSTATAKAVLYAAIQSPSTSGLLNIQKSTDGGATWTTISSAPDYMSGQGWYNNAIAVSPSNANNVFAGGSGNGGSPNLIESTDGGATWTDISFDSGGNGPHTDEHALTFDANGKLLSGSDGGIWRLNNASPANLSWQDINGNLETIQFTGISLHPTNSSIAYGGSQDNGTEGTTGSKAWNLLVGGDGGHTRVDLTTPTTIYQTFTYYNIERSDNSGASFSFITSGLSASTACNFYVPYVMDPANTSRLLLGTDSLFETTNKGASWINRGNFSATGAIDAIAVNGNTIYVAAGGTYAGPFAPGALFVTTNDGTSWTNVTPSGFNTHFADLAVDSGNAQHAFAVVDHFSVPHVYTTTNGGSTWSDISGNLPNLPVNAVKYDHAAGTIYIGTDMGVYSSTGNGTWTQFGTGLPNARVVDLDLNTSLGLLGAGTHGRSMWEISTQTNNNTPVISSISPTSTTAGSGAFTLTVNGSNFVNGAAVQWNGTALTTTFVSSSKLTASVPASDVATAGTASVTVAQNGKTSNAVTFTINSGNPVPFLKSISPASKNAGGPAFTLTATGSSFINGSTIDWNGTALTTTFVSAVKLTATVPAGDIASPGTANVTVVTPSPGGGTSVSKPFKILLTSLSLVSASLTKNSSTGVYTATVTLKNIGFNTAPTVKITKSSLGAANTTTVLPVTVGNIAAGATANAVLTYPSTAGTSGTVVTIKVSGTFTGGTFSLSKKVTLP